MQPANNDRQRRHREATSRAMKLAADHRTCPDCQRKAALKLDIDALGQGVYWCRWCGHEHAAGLRRISTETVE